jgi:plastocyanin
MSRLAMLGFFICLAALTPTSAFADTVVVTLNNFFFDPPEVFILPADVVDWQNVSGVHSTTSDDGLWNFGPAFSPWDFQVQFTNPGDYHYYCSVHGAPGGVGMAGIVHVMHPSRVHLEPPTEIDPAGLAPVGDP